LHVPPYPCRRVSSSTQCFSPCVGVWKQPNKLFGFLLRFSFIIILTLCRIVYRRKSSQAFVNDNKIL
jgi:hypothetical protein